MLMYTFIFKVKKNYKTDEINLNQSEEEILKFFGICKGFIIDKINNRYGSQLF